MADPWIQIEQLNDSLPFLLVPVRIETRFMPVPNGLELWIRVFPDDIAVHTHEKELIRSELAAGQAYWREMWRARHKADGEEGQRIERGAWRRLASGRGAPRASWIAKQTNPKSLAVTRVEDLQFPAVPRGAIKSASWSRAPSSRIMPDCFVFMGFQGRQQVFRELGKPIPRPLILGPDPQESNLARDQGRIVPGQDLAWIYDFKQAIQAGMGVKVKLEHTQRLDRLLVLGLRLSANAKQSQALIEELLENHCHAIDGMRLLPQGTPTNNTGSQSSGFSSGASDVENEARFASGTPLFAPKKRELEKTDGQRLAEALGVGYGALQQVEHANDTDVREALLLNRALWSATLGYFLEEMLAFPPAKIDRIREFFLGYVTGRGPLPALRVAKQPYGVLLTSSFASWKWPAEHSEEEQLLNEVSVALRQAEATWRTLRPRVAHIGAPGDPYQNLLYTLGLNATSVAFYRRYALGREYLWNYDSFLPAPSVGNEMLRTLSVASAGKLKELGYSPGVSPLLFNLAFFQRHEEIGTPIVDDIAGEERESLSETKRLRAIYKESLTGQRGGTEASTYIGWMAKASFKDLRNQSFESPSGERLAVPRSLLYRLLRTALLQTLHSAAMSLYIKYRQLPPTIGREVELSNIEENRTVTRWEFLDADISQVLPEVSAQKQSVGEYLLTGPGFNLDECSRLREVRTALIELAQADLPTARLERVFVEHIDLCSYRLDAWQMGCFSRRLQAERFPAGSDGDPAKRVQGIYLGAFGWVENLQPSPGPVSLTPEELAAVPKTLHDPQTDGPLYRQPDNAGFIQGPSLKHASAAAVLRSAYRAHFAPSCPEKMAVNLSSARVRTALSLLEGVRNGQELGALLGYQFERGLHDRSPELGLGQFIPQFRQAYPLVADKITQDSSGAQIETKQARHVLDGYALVEAVFFRAAPLKYPYGVSGLPNADPPPGHERDKRDAIIREVERLADTLDSVADLSLAEGVYQFTQGNFDRAGAMLQAMTRGESPPDPEIARTPRSGVTITQRVTLHLEADGGIPAPVPKSRRASAEPGLNRWLAGVLPSFDKIQYAVQLGDSSSPDQSLLALELEPIDLVYLIADDLSGGTTELERRIVEMNRVAAKDDALGVRVDFRQNLADPQGVTLFELLPLLRALRGRVTASRPLGASDFCLPSQISNDPTIEPNPQGYDVAEFQQRTEHLAQDYARAVEALGQAIPSASTGEQPDPNMADANALRRVLHDLADFGITDALPQSAYGDSAEAKAILTTQAVNILGIAKAQRKRAKNQIDAGNDLGRIHVDRVASYRAAAQEIFGPSFNLIPHYRCKNVDELQRAITFRDNGGLTRHHQGNPALADEWLEGVARVQANVGSYETIEILSDALGQLPAGKSPMVAKPLQLPYRAEDYWVAAEYPPSFQPVGEYVSIMQILPPSGFRPDMAGSGLLIDEWSEVIPARQETTGIAFHYNQPSTEPPQALLLAVTPEVTKTWTWAKLVDILHDTLDRAQLRAVEPDLLGDTAFGHLLPAIFLPTASRPFVTISTDLAHPTSKSS